MSYPFSPTAKKRLSYKPKLPKTLKNLDLVKVKNLDLDLKKDKKVKPFFKKSFDFGLLGFTKAKKQKTNPLKVGVVFSGGQASGGHNVIYGIFKALEKLNKVFTPHEKIV